MCLWKLIKGFIKLLFRIIDTVGAYLYQTYPSSLPAIYNKMPVKVIEACHIPSDVVYRIEKYACSLPDSGRAYY